MTAAVAYHIEKVHLEASDALAIRETHTVGELPAFFGAALGEMAAWIRSQAGDEAFAGPPFARYHSLDPERMDVEAVFPLTRAIPGSGRMVAVLLDSADAAQVMHVGPYDAMMPAYQALEEWMQGAGRRPSEPVREVYLSDPAVETDPAAWRTLIVQPYV